MIYDVFGLKLSSGRAVFDTRKQIIRPVVILNSLVSIDKSDITRNGSTSEKAWKIIKK